ncbi:hypothetical protein [Micromonospora wenchangensis]|uniref:hypothetical protein n=1 Tax=Micromonospora wenchangensis TaxID=1185415 RepID=UPI003D716FE5
MAPRVFISWAHTADDWSDDRTRAWEHAIADFAYLLCDHGVHVDVDLFHYTEQGIDWTRYGPQAIAAADIVLMASNVPYWERWEGRNRPTQGAGVAREADTLKGLFNADQTAFQRKALIVVLPGESDECIPHELRRVPCYPVRSLTFDGIEALLRLFHGRPAYPAGQVRSAPDLPPAPRNAGESALRADRVDVEARLAALDMTGGQESGMPQVRRRLLLQQRLARLTDRIAEHERGDGRATTQP